MNDWMLDMLGPYSGWIMALSWGLVLLMRRSIRKRHIVGLLVLTVLAFSVFFFAAIALVVLGLGRNSTFLPLVLTASSAISIACGPAIGFWLILNWLGLTERK